MLAKATYAAIAANFAVAQQNQPNETGLPLYPGDTIRVSPLAPSMHLEYNP